MIQFFLLISFAIFYTINADDCGSIFAGPIVQEVSQKYNYVSALTWSPPYMLFLHRSNPLQCGDFLRGHCHNMRGVDPQLCLLSMNGTEECFTLEGAPDVVGIQNIKDNNTHKIVIAENNTVYGWSQNNFKLLKQLSAITTNHYVSSITDTKGMTILGGISDSSRYVHGYLDILYSKLSFNGITWSRNEILQTGGIGLSHDEKHLFAADARKNVIYMWDYKDSKISNKQIIFDKKDYEAIPGHLTSVACTQDDTIWISSNHSALITLFDYKKKKIVQSIKIPSRYPTSIAYGGNNLDVLFVGTSRNDLEFDYGGGYIYAITGTGTRGVPQGSMENLQK